MRGYRFDLIGAESTPNKKQNYIAAQNNNRSWRMTTAKQEQEEFRNEFKNWLSKEKPEKPDFLLPLSFLEVGTDEQVDYLRIVH